MVINEDTGWSTGLNTEYLKGQHDMENEVFIDLSDMSFFVDFSIS